MSRIDNRNMVIRRDSPREYGRRPDRSRGVTAYAGTGRSGVPTVHPYVEMKAFPRWNV